MNAHPGRHNKHFQFQQEEDAAGVAASSAFYCTVGRLEALLYGGVL